MAADRRFTPPPPPNAYPTTPEPEATGPEGAQGEPADEKGRGVSDFFRRAVSAGFEAAKSSKNDVLRVATAEIRSWLDRMDLDKELVKALQKMTLEVKAEVRFRPNDEGKLIPETKAETKVRGPKVDDPTGAKTEG